MSLSKRPQCGPGYLSMRDMICLGKKGCWGMNPIEMEQNKLTLTPPLERAQKLSKHILLSSVWGWSAGGDEGLFLLTGLVRIHLALNMASILDNPCLNHLFCV